MPIQHDLSIDDGANFTQDTGVPNDIDVSNEIATETIEDSSNRFSK